ncbi:hypothetical protein OYT1_ch1591 [Ferriphaselus amnicola]|uniref:Phage tail protein n=1 Tax=Ferriphaselus amnicola TaxID=1188319 RepID=A0A2Z6GCA4_9PROT|nr:phage tail protein [Ferriphaselus amnicola]BBE51138.1 hypothetical protein OYT1_ch1591 [Ferriphaselus amnicola]
MLKPKLLRDFLTAQLPQLARDPDKLLVFIEKGSLVSTLASSNSFEYRYQLALVLTDFTGDADHLMLPLLVWVREHQYDLLADPSKQDGIRFESEILNHDTSDIRIELDLSERVRVELGIDGRVTLTHLDEPPLDNLTGPNPWQLYLNGELVAPA